MSAFAMYRIRTVLSGWQGALGLNTFYFDAGGVTSSADALAAVNRVRGSWDVVKSILPSVITAQTSGLVDIIDPTNGALEGGFSVATPAVVTGTGVATPGPSPLMAGLIIDTGQVVDGHRIRGRAFIGPLSQTQTQSVNPPVGVGTAIDAMGVALLTVSPPATPAICVWHRPVRDPVTHAVTRNGSQYDAMTSTHATKWFVLRSRRD